MVYIKTDDGSVSGILPSHLKTGEDMKKLLLGFVGAVGVLALGFIGAALVDVIDARNMRCDPLTCSVVGKTSVAQFPRNMQAVVELVNLTDGKISYTKPATVAQSWEAALLYQKNGYEATLILPSHLHFYGMAKRYWSGSAPIEPAVYWHYE